MKDAALLLYGFVTGFMAAAGYAIYRWQKRPDAVGDTFRRITSEIAMMERFSGSDKIENTASLTTDHGEFVVVTKRKASSQHSEGGW